MYDYAIDKFVPVRFFDYVNQTWSDQRPSTNLEIQEGVTDPALGLTYLQVAREGLGFQRSQNGGGAIPQAAPFASAYHRYGSRIPAAEHESSFFDGIDVSLNGIAALAPGAPGFLKDGLAEISKCAAEALKQYSVDRPSTIAPALADGLKATRALMEQSKSHPGMDDVLYRARDQRTAVRKRAGGIARSFVSDHRRGTTSGGVWARTRTRAIVDRSGLQRGTRRIRGTRRRADLYHGNPRPIV